MKIIKYLNKRNIGTSIYYPQPVPRMSYYKKKYGYNKNNFTNAAIISDRSISLPVGPHLTLKDLKYISENLLNSLEKILMKLKTKLIAEIGSNHNRDILRCYKLIDEAKNLGFYAVKFQLFKIKTLFSKNAKKTYKKMY